MRRLEPDAGWPDLSDAALTADVQDWLAPHLAGMSRLADLARLDLLAILRGLLPWELARRLDRDAADASRPARRAGGDRLYRSRCRSPRPGRRRSMG